MSVQSILLPVFVQVFLTLSLVILLAMRRTTLLRLGEIAWSDVDLRSKHNVWPRRVEQLANCFASQFELPVLFYLLTALAILTKKADLVFVVMAWVFVLARIGHAYVFATSNYMPARGRIFAIGAVDLLAMWAIFAVRILLAPSPGAL